MSDYRPKAPSAGSWSVLFPGLLGLVLLGALDYFSGLELNLALLYMVPLGWAAWRGYWGALLILLVLGLGAFWTLDLVPRWAQGLTWVHGINDVSLGVFLIGGSFLIWKVRRALVREQELSRTDPLTQAANFRHFEEVAVLELDRARRYKTPTTLVYLDLDGFKGVNDRLGHDVGDQLLIQTAQTLKACTRGTDLVVRFGGDEFGLLMPQSDFTGAHNRLEDIHRRLGQELARCAVEVTCSLGAVTWLGVPDSLETMIKRSDEMMYEAKKAGKNRLVHIRIS